MFSKLIKNSSSNVLVMAVKLAFTFLMTPAIVRALGNYDYGLWEIVFSVVGYMGLLDIGMRPAVVRYVAKFQALEDKPSLDSLFITSLSFSALVGLVGCISLLMWAKFDPGVLAEQGADSSRYVAFLSIIAFQILIQFPGYVADCIHAGYQRYHLLNLVNILCTVIGNSVIYYLLTHGHGLLTLALGNALGTVVRYLLSFVLLFFDKYGGFRLHLKNLSFDMMKLLLNFGGKSFAASIASTVSGSVSTLMIGFFLGPAAIPFYAIPSRLISYLSGISTTVTNVFMPAFSQLHSLNQRETLNSTYLTSTKYICSFMFPLLIGIGLLGKPFLARWMGAEYADKGAAILYLLSAANLVFLMNPLFNQLLTGINKVELLVKIRVLSTVILVISILLLIKPFGTIGVAVAFLIMTIGSKPFEISYTCRALGMTYVDFIKEAYSRLLLPNLSMAVILLITINKINPIDYSEIALVSMIGAITYLMIFIPMSITDEEKLILLGKIRNTCSK